MKPDIIVVTAAYGHAQIAALGGQRALLPIIQQAGADGVEIRRELLDDTALTDLPALGRAVAQHQLHASYSVPDTLFCDGGEINPSLIHYVEEARQLNAQRLKVALGDFTGALPRETLQALLADLPFQLTVENDQTEQGRLAPCVAFFTAVREADLPISMTFDMGNWRWTGKMPTRQRNNWPRRWVMCTSKRPCRTRIASGRLRWMRRMTTGARCCNSCTHRHRAVSNFRWKATI